MDGRIISNDDPSYGSTSKTSSCASSRADTDHENWVPTKRGKYCKIDGFMAWLDAHTEYLRKNPVLPEQREPEVLVFKL